MAANTIRYVRGDTHILSLEVKDSNGNPYIPKETDIVTMTVRLNDYKGEIVIQKVSGDGSIIPTQTCWEITFLPADTATLLYKSYVYDIELNMDGIIQTVVPMSDFVIDKEVTY